MNNTSASPVDRLRQQLDQIHTVGRQLGEDLAAHLDIADILTLPDPPAATAHMINAPFRIDFFADLPDPRDDWSIWETELLPDRGVTGPLARNNGFWSRLYLAVEAHVLAGSDAVYLHLAGGEIEVVPDATAGCSYLRRGGPTDHRAGHSGIGRLYLANLTLPEPFTAGIASALHDLRSTVESRRSSW